MLKKVCQIFVGSLLSLGIMIISMVIICTAGCTKVAGYHVTIDHSQRLEHMISAGRYDWTNGDITVEHFPLTGSGQIDINLELLRCNQAIRTEDVLREIDVRGYRPATITELLAFGADEQTEALQRQYIIIAPGSVWQSLDGRQYVPGLTSLASKRCLYLDWLGSAWLEKSLVLAVRKSRSTS